MSEEQTTIDVSPNWSDLIARWNASGKLASVWCREHNINYKAFIYQKARLQRKPTNSKPIQRSSFIEVLEEKPKKAGIEIQIKGLSLILHRDFDPSTLLRCLQVLVKAC